ncbi:secreted protein [Candidatus Magnetobacterium bavaricum]|uniref:Secreted protein n=1 Tax=Candidatus Magnetobacterium bavaricum TaxID=29290 RepID=A0A0F3GTZ8_9BACT|nr:secreted protein [Candidatus Magnetobacterium bavaricum]
MNNRTYLVSSLFMVTILLRILDSWSSQAMTNLETCPWRQQGMAVTVIAQPALGLNRGKQESMP